MTRTISLIATMCALLLALTTATRAHPGHDLTVMGTVKSIKDGHLEVEDKTGKVSTFMLAETTKILRGKARVASSEIKVGERVVAIGAPPPAKAGEAGHDTDHTMLVAKEIRLAAAKPTSD